MEKATQFTFVAAILAGTAPAVASSLPASSFLHYRVETVAGLAQEVASDPVVQARLAHHFHLSGPALYDYVHDTLVLKTLNSSSQFRVSFLNRQAQEYQATLALPAGTPVFAARDTGLPVLVAATGNPLTASISRVHLGGVGGGTAAGAATAGLGAVGLFARSGGSSSDGSSLGVSEVPSVAVPQAMDRVTLGAAPGLVIFTQVPSLPLSLEAHALIGQAVPNTIEPASWDENALGMPTSSEILGLPSPLPMAGPSALPAAPEPAPTLTFTLAALLLGGLGLRRRIIR